MTFTIKRTALATAYAQVTVEAATHEEAVASAIRRAQVDLDNYQDTHWSTCGIEETTIKEEW